MKTFLLAFLLLITLNVAAGIPATPVMTFYKFNGDLDTPYYTIDGFIKRGASSPAGYLAQGSSVIPCLVIRNGKPLTDRKGIPYVGIEVLVNSRQATLASSELFKKTVAARKAMSVTNHHCDSSVKYVMNVRTMFNLGKAPFFAPPIPAGERPVGAGRQSSEHGQLDDIVQAFHNSPECELANRSLIGRRQALSSAWQRFIDKSQRSWPKSALARAKHLDYTMRTAIFEGHLGRGCNAYGACERNIIALSIRNRGRGKGCAKYQGCRFPGDYQGVASKVSQYNIWDAYLTQISGLTSCFLRALPEPSGYPSAEGSSNPAAYYDKIRSMYNQNVDDVQQILYGDDQALRAVFPATSMNGLERLKHYYHAPAMGKCYPNHDRIEYMSGAVARNGNDFALIANARIKVDQ